MDSYRVVIFLSKEDLEIGQSITIESILGSTISVEVIEKTKFGFHEAVISKVTGSASFTGANTFYFDPEDPYRNGFIFR